MTLDQITVVITSYKSDEKITKCLKSINNQCKTIIIENSRNTTFKEKIEKSFTNTECFIAGENLGYAKGNNKGLAKVKTKYALILNPDAELNFDTLINFLHTANKIKNFAIIGPATQDEKMKNNINELTEVESVKGFAMFLNLEEFEDIGFFDDNFFIYLEEIDLCKRLKDKSEKIFIAKNAKIKHFNAKSSDIGFEFDKCQNWHWMWSNVYYDIKNVNFIFAFKKSIIQILKNYFKAIFFIIFLKKKKSLICYLRASGAFNSLMLKDSWYRPKIL